MNDNRPGLVLKIFTFVTNSEEKWAEAEFLNEWVAYKLFLACPPLADEL